MLPGFEYAKLNDIESFESKVTQATAAILIESIQGEGGIHESDTNFLKIYVICVMPKTSFYLLMRFNVALAAPATSLLFKKQASSPMPLAWQKVLEEDFPSVRSGFMKNMQTYFSQVHTALLLAATPWPARQP